MPASPSVAQIHDVSEHGCRLEMRGSAIEPGATALLEMAPATRVSGQVVWVRGNVAGVRFARPLGRAAAAAFGIPQPEPEPAEVEVVVPEKPGLLHHWFRRLTRCFS